MPMSNAQGKVAAAGVPESAPRPAPERSGGPRVAVIDDDDSIRFLVHTLLERDGIAAATYPSAEAFLADFKPGTVDCLVLDLHLPGISGLELQETLRRGGNHVPIIFFTAQGRVVDAVAALKGGAVDFVEKPFDNREFVGKVRDSLAAAAQRRGRGESAEVAAGALAGLSPREREVMDRVVAGQLNKRIADELGISIKTVEFHRARIMQKTGAQSVAQLVQIALGSRAAERAQA
jgi:FixJ family two-component response regulator